MGRHHFHAFTEASPRWDTPCGCTADMLCAEHQTEAQARHYGFASASAFRAECLRLSLLNMRAADDEPSRDYDFDGEWERPGPSSPIWDMRRGAGEGV